MKPFKIHQMPIIGMELFLKKYNNSQYVDVMRGANIMIKRPESGVFNIDGEPVLMEKDIQIKMLPEALKVIVP
jgi:diacylglycerol kinase family enzyme